MSDLIQFTVVFFLCCALSYVIGMVLGLRRKRKTEEMLKKMSDE